MENSASSYLRFLEGDDDAFSEIVRDYKDGLILYINGYVNNIFVAEDLMEETFLKILIKRPKYSQRFSFKTWLYTIGRNVSIDYLRHNSKKSYVSADEMQDMLCDEYDLERTYIISERKIILHRALKKLSVDYRQVLFLIFFEELSSTEAGKVMKKSSRQMKNLIYRAKNALRTELDKEGFVYERL